MMKKLLSLIICCVITLILTGCGNKKNEKVVTYLENNNYKCSSGDYKYTCTIKEGVKEHKFIIHKKEKNNIRYYYNNETINYEIVRGSLVGEFYIVLKDNNTEEEKCNYYVEDLKTVQCEVDGFINNCITANSDCRNYLTQVKESISLYTDLFKDNDLKLPEVKNK